jgi:hypothetical protein
LFPIGSNKRALPVPVPGNPDFALPLPCYDHRGH